jgi:hypothetical protein
MLPGRGLHGKVVHHRVVRGVRVEHLCGDPNLSEERDRKLMYSIAETSLKAMETLVDSPTVFDPSDRHAEEAVHVA